MTTPLTGSQLDRARYCAWPYRDDVSYPERESGRAADEGTEVHSMLEQYLSGEEVVAASPRAQLIFNQVKHHVSPPAMSEPAFAIDVATGAARHIGNRINRQYGKLGPNEIALTTDWCKPGEVGDLKTGFAGHVKHPRENIQVLSAAYAWAKVNGESTMIGRILIGREDECIPIFSKFDGDWMEQTLTELREIHYRTRLPSPAVAGEHCQFCPALGACPQTAHTQALVAGPKWSTERISLENDQQMVIHLPMLKKAVEAIEEALKKRGPLMLPNGKVWRETTKRIVTADKSKVEQLPGYAACLTEKEVSNGWRQVKA